MTSSKKGPQLLESDLGGRKLGLDFAGDVAQLGIEAQADFAEGGYGRGQQGEAEAAGAGLVQLADFGSEIGHGFGAGKAAVVEAPGEEEESGLRVECDLAGVTRETKSSTWSIMPRPRRASLTLRPPDRPVWAPLTAKLRLSEAEEASVAGFSSKPRRRAKYATAVGPLPST